MRKSFCAALVLLAACSSDGGSTPSGESPGGSGGGASSSGSGGGGSSGAGSGGGSGGGNGSSSSSGGSASPDAAPPATDAGGSTGESGSPDDSGPSPGDDASTGTDGASTGDDGGSTQSEGGPAGSPLLGLLSQFTAPDVPQQGPKESPPIARSWTPPAMLPTQPGNGLAQHPMLYAGEGYNEIFLVNEGKVIWTYNTAPGGEIDDVWMLSNGHIMYAHLDFLEELTPKKEVVWHYDLPTGTESHSLQPIGLDKVLFVANGQPANIILMNKTTGAMEVQHALTDAGTVTHPQFRRIRMTAAGTYLAPYLEQRKVVEYDKNFQIVWSYTPANMGTPWTALRLHNGNTLIQDEHNKSALEVNPMGSVVWQFGPTDLPGGLTQNAPQTSERLANGNTVILSPGKTVNNIQAVEVTAAKQVVWILQDWKDLGPATTAQFLDQPGIPENPGDLLH